MFRPARKGTDHSLKEYYYVLIDVELQKYTTDPYVSLASGNLCRTISTCFRDAAQNRTFVLCVDVNRSGRRARRAALSASDLAVAGSRRPSAPPRERGRCSSGPASSRWARP